MRAIVKWLLFLVVVLYLAGLAVYNLEIIRYRVTFAVPVPVLWPPHLVLRNLPEMSLGVVLAGVLIVGALVTGLAAIVRRAFLRRDLRRARRRVADLEAEVVAYRGRAARESDRTPDGDAATPVR